MDDEQDVVGLNILDEEAEREAWRQRQRAALIKNVFPYYRDKSLKEFEASNDSLGEALGRTRRYIQELPYMLAAGRGITYAGENGVGKTHLACAVMKKAALQRHSIQCVELSTFISMHMRAFQADDNDEYWDFIASVEEADLLLLDDLGREHQGGSGWSNERVFDLLRYRHNRCRPTIITTNLTFDDLDARYTYGLTSFLQEATVLITMEGPDFREKWADRD